MAYSQASTSFQVPVMIGDDEVEIPEDLLQDVKSRDTMEDIFNSVLKFDSWKDMLDDGDKERLEKLMPKIPRNAPSASPNEVMRSAFSGEDLRFGGNSLSLLWRKLASGVMAPALKETENEVNHLLMQQYKLNQANYFIHLLQELLVTRQELLQNALFAGSLEKIVNQCTMTRSKKKTVPKKAVAEQEYKRVLMEILSECGGGLDEEIGSDDGHSNSLDQEGEAASSVMCEEEYRRILRLHRKRRRQHKIGYLNEVEHISAQIKNGEYNIPSRKIYRGRDDDISPPSSSLSVPRRHPRSEPDMGVAKKDVSSGRRGRKTVKARSQHEGTTAAQAQAIYRVYTPIDNGVVKDAPIEPIVIEGPLPEGKYKCFFSLIKAVFEPLNDKKGELGKLSKMMNILMRGTQCIDCTWLNQRSDWPDLTLSALCYLAAEVGAVSSFSPMPHFLPLIEFRDRIDHWRWIGTGRDSELELLVLCNHWLDNIDMTLPVVDYSDYEPPPPHIWTNKVFQRSSPDAVSRFRQMEMERYASPHKAYTYNIRGYEGPVGPVKGSKVTKKDSISKARGHALLAPDRPTCVTILSLVRDATSRLPNGEGTRLDLCLQVQDSQFIADSVSETQLNNAVSGALDRLHYEKDPCVRYDGTRKVWIYLHRGRNEEDFERIYWACEVASKQKKTLFARPKVKPRIIQRVNGKDEVLEPGTLSEEAIKSVAGKKQQPMVKSASNSTPTVSAAVLGSLVSVTATGSPLQNAMPSVTPLLPVPQPGQLSLVVASVVQGSGGGVIGHITQMPSLKVAKSKGPPPALLKGEQASDGSSKLELITPLNEESEDLADLKPNRKRKQSLKVAELLREEAPDPKRGKITGGSPGSSSSGWTSESEDPTATKQELALPLPGSTTTAVMAGGEAMARDEDWVSSPEEMSLDTSFNDSFNVVD